MILPLEDRWGLLVVLEHEHGAKKALLSLLRKKQLEFDRTLLSNQERFLQEEAAPNAAHSFRQGKEFFRHAETSTWLAKPLLLYYAMLAVVKAGLVFRFPDFFLEGNNLFHGVSAGKRVKSEVDFESEYVQVKKSGVYPLVRKALEYEAVPDGARLPLDAILTRLPEVDATYRFVCNKQNDPINYVKIWGNIVYRDPLDNRVRIGFQLSPSFHDSVKGRLPQNIMKDFEVAAREENGQPVVKYRSKESWDSEFVAIPQVPDCLTVTLDNNFALILPMEVEGKSYEFSELELMYLIIFYLSSLARYQPHLWANLHSGTEDLTVLLCQDILRSCENKFLGLVQRELRYAGLLPLVEAFQAVKPQTSISQGDRPMARGRSPSRTNKTIARSSRKK